MERSNASKGHYNYRSLLLSTPTSPVIKVLMISNNPREMGCLSNYLRKYTWKKFNVTATFDLKQGSSLAHSQKPDYILIDGNLEPLAIKNWVNMIRKSRQLRHAAIALLKDDNQQLVVPGVQDYLLKDAIVSDTFPLKVLNAIRLKIQDNVKLRTKQTVTGFSDWFPWGINEKKKMVSS